MFFIFGINENKKNIEHNFDLTIHNCGKYARIEAYVTYYVFSLFFIPIIKWNKKYYLKYNCCNKIYELDKNLGMRLEKGENIQIRDEDLTNVGYDYGLIRCPNCGELCNPNYDFCPRCGNPLKN
ncbi:zinc ribbon domain-containing protein [Anaerosphaera multitolerans]|uniref:Zinc ribbon domain-containing protein n=1 Tax=Anaerosphaera multitolerans TaxID=2487351 RepID=A0A437S6K7_9FIRM|nr:zinc ribbon domain-containing protein [Anaerosphaera multitolerans]RVU54645.1 zinc ribbon domain-containing protein [Anaerosphaera multitolerans]